MRVCKRRLKIGLMSEPRQCIRSLNHSGYCTPDLTGLMFGKRKVLRLGKWTSGKPIRWITKLNDIISSQEGRTLISGTSKGKRLHQHGFRETVEYTSVMNHYRCIFFPKDKRYKYYKEMPFYDDWNPRKNGDLWKGAKWIIDNLGSRPNFGWSLDIINHAKGFVPGNLRWAKKGIQMMNQRHRLLQGVSDDEFAVEARRRGYVKN